MMRTSPCPAAGAVVEDHGTQVVPLVAAMAAACGSPCSMADRMRVTSLMQMNMPAAGDLVQGGNRGSLPAGQLCGEVGRLPPPPRYLICKQLATYLSGNGTGRVVLQSAKTRSSAGAVSGRRRACLTVRTPPAALVLPCHAQGR